MSKKTIEPSPYEMIYEAVEALTAAQPNVPLSYPQIADWIFEKHGKRNKNLTTYIIAVTVNAPSRIHAGQTKPRIVDHVSKRDFLFSVGYGKVVKYDPEKHGIWEIRKDRETGQLSVEEVLTEPPEKASTAFALESHLRDYLAKNLGAIKIGNKKLEYVATEYPTKVGRIDILAKDEAGNFYVFELKCSRGSDEALGQIQRYMGWILTEMAQGKQVFGIIVSERIDEKLKYALHAAKNIELFEYEVNFQLKPLAK